MSAIGSTVQRPICSIRRLGSTLGMAPCWSAAVQTRSLWGGEKKYTLFLYLFKKCLLVKRCGSGTYLDCPGKTSHGILCCKLDSGKEPASKCGRSTIHIQKDHCKYKIQGVPKKTPSYLWRLITLVWKQLLGQVGTVLESSGYELSFETKKSRIMLKHLWENCIWSWLPYHTKTVKI